MCRSRHGSRLVMLMHPWAAQPHHPPCAQLQRDARSFGSTCCPARSSSLLLGQGGSCQTKCVDWEINGSPAKASNSAVLSGSHCCSPLPILSRGAQNKKLCGLVSTTVREACYKTKENLSPSLKIQITPLIIWVLGQELM